MPPQVVAWTLALARRTPAAGQPDGPARGLPLKLYPGDVVELKKPHACGAKEWEVVQLGMDVRLRCRGCGRQVLLPRARLERRLRSFVSRPGEARDEGEG